MTLAEVKKMSDTQLIKTYEKALKLKNLDVVDRIAVQSMEEELKRRGLI